MSVLQLRFVHLHKKLEVVTIINFN